VLLVHEKLCQAKMDPFRKKLKKHFVDFFALKKLKTAFCEKLENEAFSRKLFLYFSIDMSSIS
jgi:hypothetical protein